jgi:hypothetical protein
LNKTDIPKQDAVHSQLNKTDIPKQEAVLHWNSKK